MSADGKGIYVEEPGTPEPVDHTEGAAPEAEEVEEVEEIDPETPQPGDADYVDPEAEVEEETAPPAIPSDIAEKAAFYDYVQTADGAVDFLIEAGLGLGKSVDELEAFFMGKAAQAADEETDEDDGAEVMTRAEFRAAQAEAEQRAQAQREQDQRVQQATVIQTVAIEKLTGYKVGDGKELSEKQRIAVANFADSYLDESTEMDPAEVKEALDKGFADFLEISGLVAHAPKKVVARKQVPKGLKGSTGGTEEQEEPQNLEDAFARARKRLREQGEI